MAVVFEARIKIDENNKWFIELTDTVDGRVEICNDLDEFSTKVEKLGEDYGGRIDEVNWFKDDNVLPHIMDEIRFGMAKVQEELDNKASEQGL
jgi:hypothetical protein